MWGPASWLLAAALAACTDADIERCQPGSLLPRCVPDAGADAAALDAAGPDTATQDASAGDVSPPDGGPPPDSTVGDASIPTGDAGPGCRPADCDDGIACTRDRCDGDTCVHDGATCRCSTTTSLTLDALGELEHPGWPALLRVDDGYLVALEDRSGALRVAVVDGDGGFVAGPSTIEGAEPVTSSGEPALALAQVPGGYVVAWREAARSRPMARRLDGSLAPIAASLELSATASFPGALASSDTELLALYADATGGSEAIRASRWAHAADAPEAAVLVRGGGVPGETALAWTGARFAAAWMQEYRVWTAPIARDGRTTMPPLAHSPASRLAESPSVLWTGSAWLVAWIEAASAGPGPTELRAREMFEDGAPMGEARLVADATGWVDVRAAWSPSIGAVGVVSAGAGVFFGRFDAHGAMEGERFRVSGGSVSRDDDHPAIASSDGGFVIVWRSTVTGCCTGFRLAFAHVGCAAP